MSPRTKGFIRSRIARHLAAAVISAGVVTTLVFAGVQMYAEYHRHINDVERSFRIVETGYLDSLSLSVWVYNEEQIRALLRGLRHIPEMEYVAVETTEGPAWESGERRSKRFLERTFPLIHQKVGEEKITIGRLRTVFGLDPYYARLRERAATIVVGSGFQIFLYSALLIFLFQFLVTRRLLQLADHLTQIDVNHLSRPLRLQRAWKIGKQEDEMDQVAGAIHRMQNALAHAVSNLQASEAKYRELVENANSAILRLNPSGRITFFNEYAQTVFGYTEDEILGKDAVGTIVPPVDSRGEDLAEKIRDLFINPETHQVSENENTRKDGKRLWFTWTNRPITDEQGNITEMLCIGSDSTSRKEAEEAHGRMEQRLRQSHKMEAIGTLAGGIAHDFNNILTSVIGYTELALAGPIDPHVQENLEEVLAASFRARDLVRQILSFSRQKEFTKTPVRLDTTVKEILKLLRPTLLKTIEIETRLESTETILADPAQIHQILMNLFINAAYAMRETGGRLSITVEKIEAGGLPIDIRQNENPTSCLKLTVSDTGEGIPPNIREHIFDPYFTTKEPGEGSGMGLAVVRGNVQRLDGWITVESKPGRGSEFTIYFPQAEPAAEVTEQEETDPEHFPGGWERSLIVDDEPSIAKVGKQILVNQGYDAVYRTGGNEALALFAENPKRFDLVVTDLIMPVMTGDRLFAAVRKIRPDIPVIFISGNDARITPEGAKEMGADAFLYKPLERREFLAAIRRVLEAHRGGGDLPGDGFT